MDKKKFIFGLVLRGLWFVLAGVIWGIALANFIANKDESGSWFAWSSLCLIPILLPFLRFLYNMIVMGRQKGYNTYDVSVSGNRATIANHPFKYGLIYLAVGILLGVLAGLVVLPIYFLYQIYVTVKFVLYYKNSTNPNP